MKYKVILFLRFFFRVIPHKAKKKLLIALGEIFDMRVIVQSITADPEKNGENFFLQKKIPQIFAGKQNIVLFDVGANIGNYTRTFKELFPAAVIHAFEPNHFTFTELVKNVKGISSVTTVNKGLGAEEKTETLYTYSDENASEHSSVMKEVFSDIHKSKDVVALDFQMTVLDDYCRINSVDRINFLKIDVEGYEMEVLKGAGKMIHENRIDVIQFEFNSMNVITRVFLKDFYDLLSHYTIYRLDYNQMEKLPEYNAFNERFYIQNFIAVNKSVASLD